MDRLEYGWILYLYWKTSSHDGTLVGQRISLYPLHNYPFYILHATREVSEYFIGTVHSKAKSWKPSKTCGFWYDNSRFRATPRGLANILPRVPLLIQSWPHSSYREISIHCKLPFEKYQIGPYIPTHNYASVKRSIETATHETYHFSKASNRTRNSVRS